MNEIKTGLEIESLRDFRDIGMGHIFKIEEIRGRMCLVKCTGLSWNGKRKWSQPTSIFLKKSTIMKYFKVLKNE